MRGEGAVNLGSALVPGMQCGHVWWRSKLAFPRGARLAGVRISGSPRGKRAWEKQQGGTRRSLPAVRVLGFGFQKKKKKVGGRGFGFSGLSDLRAIEGTFLILGTSHQLVSQGNGKEAEGRSLFDTLWGENIQKWFWHNLTLSLRRKNCGVSKEQTLHGQMQHLPAWVAPSPTPVSFLQGLPHPRV